MAKLLLADDDEEFRHVLAETLERMGHVVVQAREGQEALDAYAKESFDLVLMDLIMPKREGIETIREMTKCYPGVKIIAMSGGGMFIPIDFLRVARQVGAVEILIKPFSADKLTTTITHVLGLP